MMKAQKALLLLFFLATLCDLAAGFAAQADPVKVLSAPAYLPFPNYPGRVFYQRVASFSEQGPYSRYMVTFLTTDTDESVLAWYRDMLRQYQYRINESMGRGIISARNHKTTVLISVSRSAKPGYRTEVYLSYLRFPD